MKNSLRGKNCSNLRQIIWYMKKYQNDWLLLELRGSNSFFGKREAGVYEKSPVKKSSGIQDAGIL
jgi:hypothetical protein